MVGGALSAADLVLYPVLMQLLRAVSRDDAGPLNLAIHPFGDHFPKLAMWCEKIESVPGFDNAYPPHWK
jgi:glutathione S-transferase